MTKKPKPLIPNTSKPAPRSAVSADTELGERIRQRRVERRMSQQKLGTILGVSFQQIQKYEKGVNRVNANRLAVIASALMMRPEQFYPSADKSPDVTSLIVVTDKMALRMLRAWSRIKDQDTQRQMVALIETIAKAPSNDRSRT